ncbi:MAG: DNA topoisomerase [Candidatus Hodarchaeales archaeon]|jgi:DNA topoisomerase-1
MVPKVLVIGEKPSQIKTIANTLFTNSSTEKFASRLYLRTGQWNNKELIMIRLIGHITTIDTSKEFGWNKCQPLDIVLNSRALILHTNQTFRRVISQKAKIVDELWLATDPDSEGDNIAYEAFNIAISANPSLKQATKRVWNSSLTKPEIIRSFRNLIPWELYLALAVQGRRMVDAWVGFAGTRQVTETARKVIQQRGVVLSVGRVQLPTLKLIVDRDRERSEFQQKLKYNILADVLNDNRKEVIVTVKHDKSPFEEEMPVKVLLNKIQGTQKGIITEFKTWKTTLPPPRPWNTTDALALLTKELKIKANAALSLLTTLYENGYISYPRTENRRFKDNFPHSEILLRLEKYANYNPLLKLITNTSQVRTNGKKQGAEDHDPIHPTGQIPIEDNKITKLHLKAWDYVSRFYIGMFLPDLIQTRGSVRAAIKEEPFSSKYQQTTDEGWIQAITWKKPKETKEFFFTVDQIVNVDNIRSESFNTKPPPQWNDSTLIRKLEKLRIGTKSSRPEIINKLESRKYIARRRKTFCESTSMGHTIIQVFEKIWPELVTPDFTRMVEAKMDDVATKRASYESMLETLRQHYIQLHKKLLSQLPELEELLKREMVTKKEEKSKSEITKQICPLCQQGRAIERFNIKTKRKFFGCTRYPQCKWTSPSKKARDGKIVPTQTLKDVVGPCPDCTGTLILKRIKDYRLVGCSEYPKCQNSFFLPKKGRLSVLKNKECPNCKRHMVSHISKSGKNKEALKRTFCIVC